MILPEGHCEGILKTRATTSMLTTLNIRISVFNRKKSTKNIKKNDWIKICNVY